MAGAAPRNLQEECSRQGQHARAVEVEEMGAVQRLSKQFSEQASSWYKLCLLHICSL